MRHLFTFSLLFSLQVCFVWIQRIINIKKDYLIVYTILTKKLHADSNGISNDIRIRPLKQYLKNKLKIDKSFVNPFGGFCMFCCPRLYLKERDTQMQKRCHFCVNCLNFRCSVTNCVVIGNLHYLCYVLSWHCWVCMSTRCWSWDIKIFPYKIIIIRDLTLPVFRLISFGAHCLHYKIFVAFSGRLNSNISS